jgi:hypothetical protein
VTDTDQRLGEDPVGATGHRLRIGFPAHGQAFRDLTAQAQRQGKMGGRPGHGHRAPGQVERGGDRAGAGRHVTGEVVQVGDAGAGALELLMAAWWGRS